MGALQNRIKEIGLEEQANNGNSVKAQLIVDIGKATTIAQLKTLLIQLVQGLDK
jgi:hypothetical protein